MAADSLLRLEADFECEVVAAAEGDKPRQPTARIRAYSGGEVMQGFGPCVIDISGLELPATIPLLAEHDWTLSGIVGQGTPNRTERELTVDGVLIDANEIGSRIVALARGGMKLQASVGVIITGREELNPGNKVELNGRSFKAGERGLTVIRSGVLREVSIVAIGADRHASAKIAAKAEQTHMSEEIETKAAAPTVETKATPEAAPKSVIAHEIEMARLEANRREGIRKIVADYARMGGVDLDALEKAGEDAIASKLSVDTFETRCMRTIGLPRLEASAVGHRPPPQAVLEAAMMLHCGVPEKAVAADRRYGERVMNEAVAHQRMSVVGLLGACLAAMGLHRPYGAEETFTECVRNRDRLMASGLSTISLPGIIGAVANKMLLASFDAVGAVYQMTAQLVDVSNFHTHTWYRMDDLGEFEEVGATGELKHGKLTEASFTNTLKTYGRLLGLSRQAIINDDLSAFVQLPQMLGRKAKLAVEKAHINDVMESSDVFYSSARGNLCASNGLSISHLATAEAAMAVQTDADGEPIYAVPSILLVPPGLKAIADSIFQSDYVNSIADATSSGTAVASREPTANTMKGRFRVASSPYMALSAMTGYSATTWYLLANPADLAAFQVAFLSGKRAPTVETADAVFDTLGIQFRCYFDFGTAQMDYRGAVKSTA